MGLSRADPQGFVVSMGSGTEELMVFSFSMQGCSEAHSKAGGEAQPVLWIAQLCDFPPSQLLSMEVLGGSYHVPPLTCVWRWLVMLQHPVPYVADLSLLK